MWPDEYYHAFLLRYIHALGQLFLGMEPLSCALCAYMTTLTCNRAGASQRLPFWIWACVKDSQTSRAKTAHMHVLPSNELLHRGAMQAGRL